MATAARRRFAEYGRCSAVDSTCGAHRGLAHDGCRTSCAAILPGTVCACVWGVPGRQSGSAEDGGRTETRWRMSAAKTDNAAEGSGSIGMTPPKGPERVVSRWAIGECPRPSPCPSTSSRINLVGAAIDGLAGVWARCIRWRRGQGLRRHPCRDRGYRVRRRVMAARMFHDQMRLRSPC